MNDQADRPAGRIDEVVKRNIEESRRLLDARQERHDERSRAAEPRHEEARHADQDVIPDQVNLPLGGNTGSQIREGRKRRGQA